MMHWFKDNLSKFVLALALGIAAFFHLRNLHGVIYLDEDEARAFALLKSGPGIYLMGHPIYSIFHTQESVFYLAGCLGLLSTVMFYALCRQVTLDRSLSALATLIYAMWPFRINYARTLFPAVFVEPFFLLAFLALTIGVYQNKYRWAFVCGIACSALLYVHLFSYCIVVGIFFAFIYFIFSEKMNFKNFWGFKFFGMTALGFFVGAGALETLLEKWKHYSYIQATLSFQKDAALYPKSTLLTELYKKITISQDALLIFFLAAGTFLYAIFWVAKNNDKRLKFFLIPYIGGVSLFMILASRGLHTFYERHFVWLVSGISMTAALFIMNLLRSKKILPISLAVLAMSALSVICICESYWITQETFRITDFREWVHGNHIERRALLTSWWQINARDGEGAVSNIPGGFVDSDHQDQYNFLAQGNKSTYVKYRIAWRPILKAYHLGMCKYLMTSGISLRASLGEEPLLSGLKPIQSWEHPYSAHKHRPYYQPIHYTICVYNLDDVFGRAGLR